jgi:hypothetical protein
MSATWDDLRIRIDDSAQNERRQWTNRSSEVRRRAGQPGSSRWLLETKGEIVNLNAPREHQRNDNICG